MLEKLVEEYGGCFLFVKVDFDVNFEFVQYFGVCSILLVKVLFQGQLVDEFNGVLLESQICEFFDCFVLFFVVGGNLCEEVVVLVGEGKFDEVFVKLVEVSKVKLDDQVVQFDVIDVLM